jgi:uncharacterized protein YbjQ (UPF0145 family)
MSDEDSSPQTQDADQRASLARLEAGGIPLSAQRRLSELGEGDRTFTSDLSVADFALCHGLGMRPLSQVMGTSVYQIGYQAPLWGAQAESSELGTISAAWNEARSLAFGRLEQEATAVGAAAVVGVNVTSTVGDWQETGGYGAIQYLVTGTAVSRGGGDAGEQGGRGPVLTELSIADYAKLIMAGIEPVGIVAWTAVFFVSLTYLRAQQPLLSGMAYQNFEYREVTESFYAARERVTGELGRQAKALGATGIVGVRIAHTTRPQALNMGPGSGAMQGVVASFSAIGTAVREPGQDRVQRPQMIMDLTARA